MSTTTDETVAESSDRSVTAKWASALECSPYSGQPASIKDVVDYTRAGGWVPGDHEWYWELPGYLYGYLIAIPVTVSLYAISWVLQRPGRLAVVALVVGLLWWAAG